MAANSTLSLTSLDFDTLKANFIKFLQSQSVFKDYNFTGSNLNVLLDVVSYNSYLNSFYLNMVASEMFLDSAQNYNSVISHVKELNYTPISCKSSVANVSFTLTSNAPLSTITVPRGTSFSGINSNGIFTFTTNSSFVFTSTSNTYVVNSLPIFEGNFLTDAYIMDYTIQNQQFVLSNPNIDTSSLNITVQENNVNTIFSVADSLFGLTSNSNVYFLQGAQDGKYEILFGDNLFGRTPLNSAVIYANYRVTSGTDADNVYSFVINQNAITSVNGNTVNISVVTVNANSGGGSNAQSIDSIKLYAPRYFATQERAVASDDFKSLILAQYGGAIADVAVYGGELLMPKQYGSVALCLKPFGGSVAPNYLKNQITNYLLNYDSIPTTVIITDPDYYYCGITCNVAYSSTSTNLGATDISSAVLNAITTYSNTNMGLFNGSLRYSQLATQIDNADPSIISNDMNLTLIKRTSPIVGITTTYNINYNNPAAADNTTGQLYALQAGADEPAFWSDPFTYIDVNGVSWMNSTIRDDNYGNILVYQIVNNTTTIINNNIGSINYNTGVVSVNNLTIGSYNGNYFNFYLDPSNKDVLSQQNQILLINPNDVSITVTAS